MRVEGSREGIKVVEELGLEVLHSSNIRADRSGDRYGPVTSHRSGIEDPPIGHHADKLHKRVIASSG